jgi:hypothetical protein
MEKEGDRERFFNCHIDWEGAPKTETHKAML